MHAPAAFYPSREVAAAAARAVYAELPSMHDRHVRAALHTVVRPVLGRCPAAHRGVWQAGRVHSVPIAAHISTMAYTYTLVASSSMASHSVLTVCSHRPCIQSPHPPPWPDTLSCLFALSAPVHTLVWLSHLRPRSLLSWKRNLRQALLVGGAHSGVGSAYARETERRMG